MGTHDVDNIPAAKVAPRSARGYVICRNARGGYRVFRVRRSRLAVPAGWTMVEAVGGWEAAQALLSTLVAEREAENKATIDAANLRLRTVLGQTAFGGRRLRITEAELAQAGMAATLDKHVRLTTGEKAYLGWLEAGRPTL